jgi:hypothetical protein
MTEPLVADSFKGASATTLPVSLEGGQVEGDAHASKLVDPEGSLIRDAATEQLVGLDSSLEEVAGEEDELLSCGSLRGAARSVLLLLLLPGTVSLNPRDHVLCRANKCKSSSSGAVCSSGAVARGDVSLASLPLRWMEGQHSLRSPCYEQFSRMRPLLRSQAGS